MNISNPRPRAMSSTPLHDQQFSLTAQADVPVLITSEHHDERLHCASAVHAQSARRNAPFVEFDCRAWCALDGDAHARMAADRDQVRSLRNQLRGASDGTLFLDRIEMMSSAAQAELFHLFDEAAPDGVVLLNGICAPRIVSGAHRSLRAAIVAGTFDESLFYRLNVIHLDFTDHRLETRRMNVRALDSTSQRSADRMPASARARR